MTKEAAAAFINALNAVRREVRPIDFDIIALSAVAQLALAVANGTSVVEVKPADADKPAV